MIIVALSFSFKKTVPVIIATIGLMYAYKTAMEGFKCFKE